MSLFSMGINSLEISEERLTMAELEFESLTRLFNGILDGCKSKCIPPRYGEEDLNKGEMCCIDRCVAKYFKTNLIIGDKLRSTGQGVTSFGGPMSQGGAVGGEWGTGNIRDEERR